MIIVDFWVIYWIGFAISFFPIMIYLFKSYLKNDDVLVPDFIAIILLTIIGASIWPAIVLGIFFHYIDIWSDKIWSKFKYKVVFKKK